MVATEWHAVSGTRSSSCRGTSAASSNHRSTIACVSVPFCLHERTKGSRSSRLCLAGLLWSECRLLPDQLVSPSIQIVVFLAGLTHSRHAYIDSLDKLSLFRRVGLV